MAVATLIALALSVIFLSKQRDTASTGIYEWRMRDRTADDIDEDAALDSASTTNAPAPASAVDTNPASTNAADAPIDVPVESNEQQQQ